MFHTAFQFFSLKSWRGRTRSCYGAIGFSTFFHTSVLLAASAYVLNQLSDHQTFVIDSRLDSSHSQNDANEIVEIEIPVLTEHAKTEYEASSKMSQLKLLQLQNSTEKLQTLFPTDSPLSDKGFAAVASAQSLEKMLAELSGGTGTQSRAGQGNGMGDGKNKKKKNGFFGVSTEGVRFVFVVDRSSSMKDRHFSRFNTRYGRLQNEMEKSISSMTETQQFYIIYFNSMPTYMPGRKLVSATSENKKKYVTWMAGIPPYGNTDPRQALTTAIQLRPDVIYFLTDGEFYPAIRNQLLRLRQNVVKINTYCFGSKASEGVMRTIANRNGGQYHFVR